MTTPAEARYTDIIFEREGPVATIRLNRPDSLNAFSESLLAEFSDAVSLVTADPAINAAIVTGEGRAFCAGIDIKPDAEEGEAAEQQGVEYWRERVKREIAVLMQIWDSPKPFVAAVHSYCLGYACDLAMVCDLTVAAEDAQFGEPEIRHVSASTLLVMPFVLGLKWTKELLLTGGRIDAAKAARIGLVNEVVPAGELQPTAWRYARELALIPPTAMRLNKAAINYAFEQQGLRNAIAFNAEVFAQVMSSASAAAFDEAVRTKGFKEALAERDRSFSA
jgi:enoyl-CoA hydratase